MQNIITFTQLENYAQSLIDSSQLNRVEQEVAKEIIVYVAMQKIDFESGDNQDLSWLNPRQLIDNILDEAHDGAFEWSTEDQEVYEEEEVAAFMIKFGIWPEKDTEDLAYLGDDPRYLNDPEELDFINGTAEIRNYIDNSWNKPNKFYPEITQEMLEQDKKDQHKRLDWIISKFGNLIQWSQWDHNFCYSYLHNHFTTEEEKEKLWKKTSIHPDFKPEY